MRFLKPKRLLAVLLSVLVIAELVVSVVLSTVAEGGGETATTVKQLITFGDTTAQDIKASDWPTGISKMTSGDSFAYKSNGSVDIAEDANQEKYLKFNLDAAGTVSNAQDLINERNNANNFFVKVSVPAFYIPYVKDITVDYLYNYKQVSGSATSVQNQAYYIVGINDGTNWGKDKDTRKHYSLAPTNAQTTAGSITTEITSMRKLSSSSNFTGNTSFNNVGLWTAEDLKEAPKLDIVIMFSSPNLTAAKKNEGYFFGIKNVEVTIEGPKEEIENIDNPNYVNPHLVNFDEADTISDIINATEFDTHNGYENARASLVTDDVHTAPNAYLLRKPMNNNGNNSNPNIKNTDLREIFTLDKLTVMRSKGITFMAKNISDTEQEFRIWISPGNSAADSDEKKWGKYQYVFTLPANMEEYKRITFYWDNVGKMSFAGDGKWWYPSTSGYSVTDEELASGITLRLTYPKMDKDAAGVLFDTFEYVTPAFAKERNVTVADFENSDIGKTDIPENITIGGTYHGSAEIVEDGEGNKGLQLNYDVEQTEFSTNSGEGHHLRYRPYFQVSIKIPKGALKGASGIVIDAKNNRTDAGEFKQTENKFSGTAYLIAFSNGDDYGKDAEMKTEITWTGENSIAAIPSEFLHTVIGGVPGYVNKETANKWTDEELAGVDTLYFYVTAPYTEGAGTGESFTINNIAINYAEPPEYDEATTREIFKTNKSESLIGNTIKVTETAINNADPNYVEFDKAYKLECSEGNTEGVTFTNDLIAFNRNLIPFVEKAVFHIFADVEEETLMELVITDKNAVDMTYQFVAKPSKTNLYGETSVSIKEIYDAYIAANNDGAFDLSDIRKITVTPKFDGEGSVLIANPTILTGEFVSGAEDPEKLKNVNLINFDNMRNVDELPLGLKVNNGYGTLKLIEKEDGSKALRIYYDEPCSIDRLIAYNQVHQIVNRTINVFTVTVPTGSLKGLKKINYTVNANVPAFDDSNRYPNTYYQTVVHGGGNYFKANQNALKYTQTIGQENVVTFDLYAKNTIGCKNTSGMANWLDPIGALKVDDDYAAGFTTIYITIGAPECDGTEGYWFELSSIDLEFDSEPKYEETETRTIVEADRFEKTESGNITVTTGKLESNDKNYRKFKTFYTIAAKKGNNEPVVFKNGNINFLRNAKTFLETATFRVYIHSDVKSTVKFALVNLNGERLPFEINIKKTEDKAYDEYTVSLKEIYEKFITNNTEDKFSLYKIIGVELLPDSSKDIQFNVAEISLWSKEAGSGASAGNYYDVNEADTARIEGYNYAIPEDFTTTIETYSDIAAKISEDGIRVPKGLTPVAIVKYTLRNGLGAIAEPNSSFWISIKVPEGVDMSDIGIYRVFLDGSLVKLTDVIEPDRFITANTFFSMDTFVVLSGVYSVKNLETEDTTDLWEEPEDYISNIENEETEQTITTPTKVVRRKKILRKKKVAANDLTWLWIVIIVSAVVVVTATGLVIFFIVRKKRKNRKENIA